MAASIKASQAVLGYVDRNPQGRIDIMTHPIGYFDKTGLYRLRDANVLCRKIGYLLSCCGSSDITNVGNGWDDEKAVQGFVCHLFRTMNWKQTYYFIAATYQLEEAKDYKYGTTATILQSLGAKQVDDSPNRNHGPHNMYLHVWNPETFHTGWDQFIDVKTHNPLWFSKLSPEEQQKENENASKLLAAYTEARTKQSEIEKKARADNKAWDAYYLIRDGLMVDRLAYYGLKVVDKNGNDYPAKRPDVPQVKPVGSTVGPEWKA